MPESLEIPGRVVNNLFLIVNIFSTDFVNLCPGMDCPLSKGMGLLQEGDVLQRFFKEFVLVYRYHA